MTVAPEPIETLLSRLEAMEARIEWDSLGLWIDRPTAVPIPEELRSELRARRSDIVSHLEGVARERARALRERLEG